ncbi:hypothetical protein D5F01_LYC11079 [Larimichthys crocea]|uniref:Uncharacterized protein n=1 Tax=Larimichthys crocea TaxID=215358 RepID=A0A6G0IJN6_LARCR|nr:hypothetical protein D5F01_LYC11079 [Larimichthys crocea]
MSRLQAVKVFIQQRLSAAVEEIFGHLERTITECEEEMESRHRHQQLLDAELQRAVSPGDVQQPLLVKEEQQEWSAGLEPPIKEEKEDSWTSQDDEQLQGLREEDITKFPFTHVLVKSEDDEDTPQSSQLHQRQTEEKVEAEPRASSSSIIDHEIRKITFQNSLPSSVEDLIKVFQQAFFISTGINLQYKDADFDDFFTLTSTSDLKDKDTLKVVHVPPGIIVATVPQERNADTSDMSSVDDVHCGFTRQSDLIHSPPAT